MIVVSPTLLTSYNYYFMVQKYIAGAMLFGAIVITTPSGNANFVSSNGAASHTTSNYSAQVNDVVAGPGEHAVSTSAGVMTAGSNGAVSTVTVVAH